MAVESIGVVERPTLSVGMAVGAITAVPSVNVTEVLPIVVVDGVPESEVTEFVGSIEGSKVDVTATADDNDSVEEETARLDSPGMVTTVSVLVSCGTSVGTAKVMSGIDAVDAKLVVKSDGSDAVDEITPG